LQTRLHKIQGPTEDAGNIDSDPGARGFSTRERRNLQSTNRDSRIRNATSEGGELTPEVEDKTLEMALGAFGEICDIQPEIWSNAYSYRVSN